MSSPATTVRRMTAACAALALALGIQAPALAAQDQAPPAMPQQEAPSVEVSDAEMEQFVTTYVEVERIQLSLNEELQAAPAPEEAEQLQQEANDEMASAISENGMEVERFSLIVQAINADPELQQEFAAKRTEMVDEQ